MILAIDPGTTQSAFCVWDGDRLQEGGILPNDELLGHLRRCDFCETMAIECVASYGMAVGAAVFATVMWCGRFIEAHDRTGGQAIEVYRKDVKMHLCHSMRAKDANIRQALIDRFGPPGTKKSPGPLYGAKSHIWAALAVGVYAFDTRQLLGA